MDLSHESGRVNLTATCELSHIQTLESESVHIFRKVFATTERPALMLSGRKESVVMLRPGDTRALTRLRYPFWCCTSTPATPSTR